MFGEQFPFICLGAIRIIKPNATNGMKKFKADFQAIRSITKYLIF